ncbi:MAG: lactate utilization protein [Sulfobacillus benefaciens]|uniref:Lactate utilization protein n=1 Tax=Sulfobacillus benefaciens TaxID=453960 RepID=A0A2T2XD51_9FIRM|nr:MAG: lactate utilization protein [Sulfobacillus benefaciens]
MDGQLPIDTRPWPVRRDAALHDQTMQQTIGVVTKRLANAKVTAYAAYPEANHWRQRAVEVKRQSIRQLEEHLATFTQQVESHGGKVHRATTAADAIQTILEVAQHHQVRSVIKTKSMVTEELELNRALENAGIAVRETDLGEYIIQLAHEKPSHILAPALHKNREQIHALFDQDALVYHTEPPASEDIVALTQYARRRLREEFLAADMGVTGGNFLVAETGTVVLITNEGNADMVTTLPRLLVSVVGVEKIVADWSGLIDVIQQPALSGVGQRLSSYTTLVSGTRGPDQWEGPDEWHVVLLDNGRTQLKDTPFEDVLSCIRCGACLNVCPVFRQVGGHAYGSVYPGPIGIVETPLLTNFEVLPELPSALCTLCHACGEACPMNIDLPGHIVQLRQMKQERHMNAIGVTRSYRWWARFWATPHGYRRSMRWARWGQWWFVRHGRIQSAPGLAGGWFKTRDMPPVASMTFHEWWDRTRGKRQ